MTFIDTSRKLIPEVISNLSSDFNLGKLYTFENWSFI